MPQDSSQTIWCGVNSVIAVILILVMLFLPTDAQIVKLNGRITTQDSRIMALEKEIDDLKYIVEAMHQYPNNRGANDQHNKR